MCEVCEMLRGRVISETFERWGVSPEPSIFPDMEVFTGPKPPLADVALFSLLLENPSLSLEQLQRFPEAIEGTEGTNDGGTAFLTYAKEMLAEPNPSNNTLTYFIDKGGSSPFFDTSGSTVYNDLNNVLDQVGTLEQSKYEKYIRKKMSVVVL